MGNWECPAGAGLLCVMPATPSRHDGSQSELVAGVTSPTCRVLYQQREQNHATLERFHENALGTPTVPGTTLVAGDAGGQTQPLPGGAPQPGEGGDKRQHVDR